MKRYRHSRRRLTRAFFLVGLAWVSAFAHVLSGQIRGPQRPAYPEEEALDPEEGRRVLEIVRGVRLEGDYSLRFTLTHRKRQAAPDRFGGQIWGTDRAGTPVTRIAIEPIGQPDAPPRQFLLETGPQASAYVLVHDGQAGAESEDSTGETAAPEPLPDPASRENAASDFAVGEGAGTEEPRWRWRALPPAERLEPMYPGIHVTPMDFQLSFLFWEDIAYQGKSRELGRSAHLYLARPEGSLELDGQPLSAVRFAADAQFAALLRIEYLGTDGGVLKSIRVTRIKKVREQWLVKQIDLVDERSRARTRFQVRMAALDIGLPADIFKPGDPAPADGIVPLDRFESL